MRRELTRAPLLTVTWLLAIAALAACGGAPPPTERLTRAEAAIRGASEVGASGVPRAELHLRLAQEQVGKAKRAMEDGLNLKADYLLRQAYADAELAIAMANEDKTIQRAQAAKENLGQIKSEGRAAQGTAPEAP